MGTDVVFKATAASRAAVTPRLSIEASAGSLLRSSIRFAAMTQLSARVRLHYRGIGGLIHIRGASQRRLVRTSASRSAIGCGGQIRTDDLRVMGPASFLCSTPRCSQELCLRHSPPGFEPALMSDLLWTSVLCPARTSASTLWAIEVINPVPCRHIKERARPTGRP